MSAGNSHFFTFSVFFRAIRVRIVIVAILPQKNGKDKRDRKQIPAPARSRLPKSSKKDGEEVLLEIIIPKRLWS
jgi:hypothetical protein